MAIRRAVSRLALLVFCLTLAVVFVVQRQPDTFTIQRSALIPASPAAIFPLLADLHQWPRWSTWDQGDPKIQRSYQGPTAALGSTCSWVADPKAGGQGRMTLTAVTPDRAVDLDLQLFKPWKGALQMGFTLQPLPAGTVVTWTLRGKTGFGAKAFHLFLDVDKMVGAVFEPSLARIKETVAADQRQRGPLGAVNPR